MTGPGAPMAAVWAAPGKPATASSCPSGRAATAGPASRTGAGRRGWPRMTTYGARRTRRAAGHRQVTGGPGAGAARAALQTCPAPAEHTSAGAGHVRPERISMTRHWPVSTSVFALPQPLADRGALGGAALALLAARVRQQPRHAAMARPRRPARRPPAAPRPAARRRQARPPGSPPTRCGSAPTGWWTRPTSRSRATTKDLKFPRSFSFAATATGRLLPARAPEAPDRLPDRRAARPGRDPGRRDRQLPGQLLRPGSST